MLFFSLIYLFTGIVLFEMNRIGKIIFVPFCILAWIVCLPLMLGELVILDIWAILFGACTPIGVYDVLEFLLFPIFLPD